MRDGGGVDSRRGDGDTQRSGLIGRKAAAGWETRWVGVLCEECGLVLELEVLFLPCCVHAAAAGKAGRAGKRASVLPSCLSLAVCVCVCAFRPHLFNRNKQM